MLRFNPWPFGRGRANPTELQHRLVIKLYMVSYIEIVIIYIILLKVLNYKWSCIAQVANRLTKSSEFLSEQFLQQCLSCLHRISLHLSSQPWLAYHDGGQLHLDEFSQPHPEQFAFCWGKLLIPEQFLHSEGAYIVLVP